MLLSQESMKYFFIKYHNILTKLSTRINSIFDKVLKGIHLMALVGI
jgi:hypothetical protein